MPLFMDLHKASDYEIKPTLDDIKRNHIADLAVQSKYGVKFLQYWINEEAGLVFCLMEAPDKESCIAVHQEAHGGMPCNVIELQGGDYKAFAGNDTSKNEFDIVENADGKLDTGYRIIVVADFISVSNVLLHEEFGNIVHKWGGRILDKPDPRKIIIFTPGANAIECAMNIVHLSQQLPDKTNEVRIGISAGTPITDKRDIFADAIELANRLCNVAQNGQVIISSQAQKLTGKNKLQNHSEDNTLKLLSQENEQFVNKLAEAMLLLLFETSFNIDRLCKHMGMSRSHLYRKIKELTGYSANSFIQEMRMQKAFQLIRNKYGNITQVALESGFSNLSYFAKSFQKRFGVLPLKALKLNP